MARLLVALTCLAAVPGVLFGQAVDSTAVGVRVQLDTPPLELEQPAVLRMPVYGAPRTLPALDLMAWDSAVSDALDSARVARARARRYLSLYGVAQLADTQEVRPDDPGLLGLSRDAVNLSIDGQARLEIRTERLKNERCTPALLLDPNSGCRGGFQAPRIDNYFNVLSGGIIGRRVHVNIDYNSEREFTGSNDVQVYYQGLEDEIIRRIEVGTVTFRPPPSRFIAAAIPSSNFGVNADLELGPLQFHALAATQKGSVVAERTFTIGGQQASTPQDRNVRDLDFESGRFFWVIDPRTIPGYPAVDILAKDLNALLPPASRPTLVRIYRNRVAGTPGGTNPNLGGIDAVALRDDSDQQVKGQWELLVQGIDYYLDGSGLWFALTTKVDPNDHLAVSYQTAAGGQVGTLPDGSGGTGLDTLRLILDPQQGPAQPTFYHEMRQIYRVAGNDLDPGSLTVGLSLNRSERPASGQATYLAQLGLALPSDASAFDRATRLFPRSQDVEAEQLLAESYLVFPHLTPFADDSRLAPTEVSDSLYRTPLYLLLSEGPPARFQFHFHYNSIGGGDRTQLNLNSLQIREGSEQLTVNGRVLERGVDYTISYELGQVSFLNPDALFGSGSATVTARFEERGHFVIAPTSIYGMATRYSLGERGSINLIGLYQREQSASNRPRLGFEAKANLIGGINTDLHFRPDVITDALNYITSAPANAPSRLDVKAELAFSRPDPNRSGAAYLEDFQGESGLVLSLREDLWQFGSVPQRPDGLEAIGFAGGFDSTAAVALTWQNLISAAGGTALQFKPRDIDPTIQLVGRGETSETVMYLTLHADTAGGYLPERKNQSRWTLPAQPMTPRWRSIVTPLSATGMDLSRQEFLEFWVLQNLGSADSAGVRLVFDLGSVSEDALAVVPESLFVSGADTVLSGRRYTGLGQLDGERDPRTGTFDAATDDIGILGARPDTVYTPEGPVLSPSLCHRQLGATVPLFPWGDLSARCSSGNGHMDTEDLNNDLTLDASGSADNVFRYIVTLTDDAASRYFVREGGTGPIGTGGRVAKWRLYRIPLRTPDAVIGAPNMRLVQHLRVTVAAPPDNGAGDVVARFALARMRFLGSPWVRRANTPIEGLAGAVGAGHGDVVASVISTENQELGYESPPGILDIAERRDPGQDIQGLQVNERSLRIVTRDLQPGERAEAYFRFPAGPQNLLSYRELRLWVRGRGAGWEEQQLEAFVKLGSDDQNFYLYRTRARTTTWEPEIVIDLEVWRRLRGQVETRWLRGEPANGAECGADPNVYVACEGPYLVHLGSPGVNPPNLAAVQEISAGIYHAGSVAISETEVWIDDVRLVSPVSETGTAVAFDTRLIASDVGDISIGFVHQDGHFRQIGQDPSYRTTNVFRVGSRWQLDRFLPASLGLNMPATITYSHTAVDPQLVSGTDLRGSALDGLRRPGGWNVNYSVALRRNREGEHWLTRGLIDPLTITVNHSRGHGTTELSRSFAKATTVNANYNLRLPELGISIPFLGGLVASLPDWLSESEGGKAASNPTFNLLPSNIRWSSGLSRDEATLFSYQVPIERSSDAAIRPTASLEHTWRNSAGMTWQPIGMVTLNADLASVRDLRHYSDSTEIGRLTAASRRSFLGLDVGVERSRTFATSVIISPRISSWLRPRFNTSSSFVLNRSLVSRDPVREVGDTAGAFILPQTLNNSRTQELGASVDLGQAVRSLFGDSSAVTRALDDIQPIDVSRRRTRTSTFDLAAFEPTLSYQLGLGGMQHFLGQFGELAVGASEVHSTTISSGAELPFGLSARLSYSETLTDRFKRGTGGLFKTVSEQREWPVGNVRFTHTFGTGPISLLALGASFRHREGTATQPTTTGDAVVNGTVSSSLTPDLQIGLRNDMSFLFTYNSLEQQTQNAASTTFLEQADWNGTFTYSFRLPRMISQSRKRMRTSLTALASSATTCLQRRGEEECVTVSDVSRQEIRGGLGTDLMDTLAADLEVGYTINDAAHLDRRTSQLFMLVSFTLSLFSGDYR